MNSISIILKELKWLIHCSQVESWIRVIACSVQSHYLEQSYIINTFTPGIHSIDIGNKPTKYSTKCIWKHRLQRVSQYVPALLKLTSRGPFYEQGLIWIPSWISNYIHDKVWGEITYPFSNFNSCLAEVWKWISDFIPHFTGNVIT